MNVIHMFSSLFLNSSCEKLCLVSANNLEQSLQIINVNCLQIIRDDHCQVSEDYSQMIREDCPKIN